MGRCHARRGARAIRDECDATTREGDASERERERTRESEREREATAEERDERDRTTDRPTERANERTNAIGVEVVEAPVEDDGC